MTGQGSPRASSWKRPLDRPWARALRSLCAVLACVFASSNAAGVDLRLRLAWGDGEAVRWRGSISLSEGTLSAPTPLAIEPDESGSIWLESNTLRVNARSERRYEGVDVSVDAPLDANLIVRLGAAGASGERELTIPLRKLIRDIETVEIDERANRLVARRTPGDSLRVEIEREHLVFAPSEAFRFRVAPHELDISADSRIEVLCELRPARESEVLWSQEFEWTAPASEVKGEVLEVETPLPATEGVYDVVITARRRSLQRLGLKQTLTTRHVQLVVVDPVPVTWANTAESGPTLLEEIDPAGPKWWERLTTVPLIPGVRRGPLGSGDVSPVRLESGAFVELAPNDSHTDVSWEAYPLPVKQPGQPHLLEIEFPANVHQNLGISIIEPNSAGAVAPVGVDSGLYVGEEAKNASPGTETYRLNFWPRTRTPILLMTNRSGKRSALFGKIRLSEHPGRLPAPESRNSAAQTRVMAAYFDRPLWPENFGASEAFDPGSGRSLKDWKTFHDGAAHLLEYLRHTGRNGLVAPAWSDGCAFYPSALLESTPRYDNGTFFSTAQDASRKDVLELLFRMCDREGIVLTPMLDFSTPLAAVETLKRQAGDQAVGLEWQNGAGQRWSDVASSIRGQAPYYNTLDPRVQDAMAAVVEELVLRYASHPSFNGVALQLSAQGYAQLPPPEWGMDSVTLAAFSRDTGIAMDSAAVRDPSRNPLLSRHRAAWLEWRAARLAALHHRLARIVASAKPGATLQLCAAQSLDPASWDAAPQANLLQRNAQEQAWLEAGISPRLYGGPDGPILTCPQRLAPAETPDELAIRAMLNQAPDIERAMEALPMTAAQFYHEPQTLRVRGFEEKSPFKSTYCWLVSQPTAVGAANRERIVHAVATLDVVAMMDGGWLLPLGQDEALRDVVDAYTALPAARFQTVAGKMQPLVARTHSTSRETYLYLVNDSPWPVNANVTYYASAPATLENLAPRRTLPMPREGTQRSTWSVSLAPFDLIAVRWNSPRVSITEIASTVPPQVAAELQGRLADVRNRAATLVGAEALDVLPNPGFELPASESSPAPSWRVEGPRETFQLDSNNPHGGQFAARVTTDGEAVSLVGPAFAAPRLGRLQISAWMRSADPSRETPLQVVVEGMIDGELFERRLAVGRVPAEWTERRFNVDGLPWEGVEAIRMRFEMLGAGEVWLDDVAITAPGFTQAEMIELGKLLKLSGDRLAAGQVRDCQQLLDGYWPRFIERRAALPERPPVDLANRPKPPSPAQAKPGMLERINKWMPRFMR